MEGRFSEGMGWSKAKNDFPWNWIDKVWFSQSTPLRTTQKIEFMVRTFPSAIFDLRCLYGLINASDRLEIHHLFSKHQKKTSKFHAVSNTMVENSLIWVNNFLTKCTKLAISNFKIWWFFIFKFSYWSHLGIRRYHFLKWFMTVVNMTRGNPNTTLRCGGYHINDPARWGSKWWVFMGKRTLFSVFQIRGQKNQSEKRLKHPSVI